jgi:hypothetical protein
VQSAAVSLHVRDLAQVHWVPSITGTVLNLPEQALQSYLSLIRTMAALADVHPQYDDLSHLRLPEQTQLFLLEEIPVA